VWSKPSLLASLVLLLLPSLLLSLLLALSLSFLHLLNLDFSLLIFFQRGYLSHGVRNFLLFFTFILKIRFLGQFARVGCEFRLRHSTFLKLLFGPLPPYTQLIAWIFVYIITYNLGKLLLLTLLSLFVHKNCLFFGSLTCEPLKVD